MKYTLIATAWIIILLNAKKDFNVACVCAVVHILCCIGWELQELTKRLIKQKEEDSQRITRALEAVGLDLVDVIRQK